jgi:hypothetical protein
MGLWCSGFTNGSQKIPWQPFSPRGLALPDPGTLQACSVNLTNQFCELHLSKGVSSEAEGSAAGLSYKLYWVLLLSLGYTANTTTTLYEYHGSIVYAMDHANLRRKHRPDEYQSSLICLGPIYQTDSNRADGAVGNLYTYAQSAFVAPYESQTPLRPGVNNTLTPQEAHNIGSASKRRVSILP